MEFIFFDVTDIIDDIDAARYQGEQEKSYNRLLNIVQVEQVAGKNKRCKEEKILNPLLEPHRGDDVTKLCSQKIQYNVYKELKYRRFFIDAENFG